MSDALFPVPTTALHNAMRAHMERIAETYVVDRAELVDAFDGEMLWYVEDFDVDAMVERLGPRIARPFLCALWDSGDVSESARVRAMTLLLSPRSVDTNPLCEFLLELHEYDLGVTARWVLENRPAIRTVWLTLRHEPRDPALRGIRALSRMFALTLATQYAGRGVPLDLPRLVKDCDTLSRAQHTLIHMGVPAKYMHLELGRAVGSDDPATAATVAVSEWERGRDAGVPVPLIVALRAAGDPLEDALTALETFRDMNAEGALPFSLVAAGLGVPEDTLTDEEWDAWCAETSTL